MTESQCEAGSKSRVVWKSEKDGVRNHQENLDRDCKLGLASVYHNEAIVHRIVVCRGSLM